MEWVEEEEDILAVGGRDGDMVVAAIFKNSTGDAVGDEGWEGITSEGLKSVDVIIRIQWSCPNAKS